MKELMIGGTNGTKLTGKVVLPDGTKSTRMKPKHYFR
jgi:hypothetical protein